ncbi:hypothetical protein [Eubacterium callanderi]|uniref:hypothetical protein n=1 Tax=Eubacterium callanderi TaxID=53442 RepID=UPI003AB50B4B
MEYLIVGINEVDFTDDKGKRIQGTRLYFNYLDDTNPNIIGAIADSKWLTKDQVDKFGIDLRTLVRKTVNIVTNMKGKIVNIIPVEKEAKQA